MLLEMVGGRKNINAEASHTSEIYFPHWAYNKLESNNDLTPDMMMTIEENEIAKRLAIVGLWCTQTFPNDRPTMSSVIDMLGGNMDSLQIPPKPLLSSPTRSVPEYSYSSQLKVGQNLDEQGLVETRGNSSYDDTLMLKSVRA